MRKIFVGRISFAVSLGFLFLIFSPKVFAFTLVDADIAEDTTWTKEQSPYLIVNSPAVLAGATLTIEPGVVVKFDYGTYFYIRGILNVPGTEAEPVHFTSKYDDSLGGDTDNEEICDMDEEGNPVPGTCVVFDWGDPMPGDWDGIDFDGSAGSILENIFIHYTDAVYARNSAEVNLKNFKIRDSVEGVSVFGGSRIEIMGGIFDNLDKDALFVFEHSSAWLEDVSISNIEGQAVNVYQNSSIDAKNISFSDIFNQPLNVYLNSSFTANGLKMGENIAPDSGWTDAINVYLNSNLTLKNSSFKNCPHGSCVAIYDDVGNHSSLNIENTIFDGGQRNGINIFSDGNLSVQITNSSFENFNFYAVENYADFVPQAENNWWGDASGPYHETLNPEGLGEKIYGEVDFEPWCESADCSSRNPVLIVPGILGTEIFSGADKLWLDLLQIIGSVGDGFLDALAVKENFIPENEGLSLGDIIKTISVNILIGKPVLFDYSGSLIEEFENQGYVEGIDLFTFPYDWRFGENATNVHNLKQNINDILATTGKNKVDVIAHSNGGLLVKKYVMENPAEHHIAKAVFVGVPNTGAPKAIKGLIVGDSFNVPGLSQTEMKKLARNFPVAYDLLPSQEYYDNKGSYVRVIEDRLLAPGTKDLNFEETNNFLLEDHNLNTQALANAQDLHTESFDNFDLRSAGVDLYNIVGCKAGTIGKITERRTTTALGGTEISYIELKETPGDGTVPLESATNLLVDPDKKYFALKASHATMLTQDGIRQQIVNILSGSSLPTNEFISQDILECKLNGRGFAVYSPVNIDVTDSEDNHLGLASDGVSTENNIPNADFEILGEHKFVYLPDNVGYQIKLKGTGIGTFTLISEDIENDETVSREEFMDIPVTTQTQGEVVLNPTTQNLELKLDVTGDGVNDFTIKPDDEFDPVLYLQIMKATINSLNLPPAKKKAFSNKVDRIIKLIQVGKIDRAKLKAERFRKAMEWQTTRLEPPRRHWPTWPKKISKTDAQLLLEMLNKLLDNLG